MTQHRISLALALSALLSAPLAAQGACDFNDGNTSALGSIQALLQRHDQSTDAEQRADYIKQAVRALTDNPGRFKSEPGRNFLLGSAYVRWLLDQKGNPVLQAKRGDLGLRDNPDGDFLLAPALTEAMSVVERQKPPCAEQTARFRNSAFASVVNAAISAVNRKSFEVAIEYANAALSIAPRAPQVSMAYQVLTRASEGKGDLAGTIAGLQKAIESMGTDTATAPERATATFNLAVFTRDDATKKDGATRTDGLRRAAVLFKAASDLAPDGPNASAARTAYARMMQEVGDAQVGASVYADMLANPAKYTAIQLFEAGVVAASGKRFEDAAKYYEAGLAQNPWYRDALFNSANVYFVLHQPDKMSPMIDKLRAIDPMNADVLKLAGAVWQERASRASDAKAKKAAYDSVTAFVDRASKLPARVLVKQFGVSRDNTTTLAGSIENLGVSPSSFVVVFELVDKTGAVVGSATLKADSVAARSVREFSVQATGAAPVAWRYTMQ
jgi:tetratricopeptide (TPR) repeat protein